MIARFFSKTKYPPQQLSDKQKELIEHIDNALIEAHKGKHVIGSMTVKYTGIGFMRTLMPVSNLVDQITLEYGDAYIPRSVALIIDTYGNWVFAYAIRTETGSDALTTMLFIDALNRTNNAR
jgi:hypothetical protein